MEQLTITALGHSVRFQCDKKVIAAGDFGWIVEMPKAREFRKAFERNK